MPKTGTERKKEDMRKNNEEVPEYKNNKEKKNYTWKQTYKGQRHKHKLETKNSSGQQINCYMVQSIQQNQRTIWEDKDDTKW